MTGADYSSPMLRDLKLLETDILSLIQHFERMYPVFAIDNVTVEKCTVRRIGDRHRTRRQTTGVVVDATVQF